MIKQINGQTWFCCPQCGKKIHPVNPGACGVFAICKQKRGDGTRCNWAGEITYPIQTKIEINLEKEFCKNLVGLLQDKYLDNKS